MVEIKGERVLAPSCCRAPAPGNGRSKCKRTPRVIPRRCVGASRLGHARACLQDDSELDHWCDVLDIGTPRFPGRAQHAPDLSHPAMAVNLDACIQCTRLRTRLPREQVNDVIGYAFRGVQSKVVFDLDDPMGASTCVACGECVQACPTARWHRRATRTCAVDRTVDSHALLRSRLSAYLSCEGQHDRARSTGATVRRTRAAFASRPLRLRLRGASASTDEALIRKPGAPKTADSRLIRRIRVGVSRSDLGRGVGAGRGHAEAPFAITKGRTRSHGLVPRKDRTKSVSVQKLVRTGFTGTTSITAAALPRVHVQRCWKASDRRGNRIR